MTTDSELRALLTNQTTGPWEAVMSPCLFWAFSEEPVATLSSPEGTLASNLIGSDARLIVAAVNSLPSLLDRLERAEAALREIAELGCEGPQYDEPGMTCIPTESPVPCSPCIAFAALSEPETKP